MAEVTIDKRAVARERQNIPMADAISRSFDPRGNALVFRPSGRGAPAYLDGKASAPRTRTVDTTNADAEAALAGSFEMDAFDDGVFYWKAGTATHTALTLDVYVLTDLGDWVLIQSFAGLAPLTESVIQGVGRRQMFVRVRSTTGGAAGTVTINVAGV